MNVHSATGVARGGHRGVSLFVDVEARLFEVWDLVDKTSILSAHEEVF